MGVVHIKVIKQPSLKGVDRTKVPALEKTASQHPKPSFDLLEPRPVFGREMPYRLRRRSAQERSPLHTSLECLGDKGEITPRCHEAADLQAPVRIEIIDHLVIVLHGWQLAEYVGQMRSKVLTGAGRAKMPQPLAGRHNKGGNQDPHPMADVCVFTFLGLAWLGQWRGMCTLENLHARLFVDTDDETTVLRETQGVDIQVADVPGLGLECRVMAIEPVHAPMRFEVSIVENPPESGAAHRPGPSVVTESRCHVIETPPRRWAVVIRGRTRSDRQDIDTLRGGKSVAADLGAAYPANRPARAQDTGCARGRRSGGDSACQPPPGDAAGRLERLHVG